MNSKTDYYINKMVKRGPKPSITHEEKVIALRKFDVFDSSGKVKKETDPIWQQVCDYINTKFIKDPEKRITKRNIQNYVSQNRNGVIFDLRETSKYSHDTSKSSHENDNKINDSTTKNVKDNIDEERELLQLQGNVMYKSVIKEVNSFPFSVTHWTMEAIDFAKCTSKNNIFVFAWVTGGLCQNFTFPDGTKSQIIDLFCFGTQINDTFISICQLSTEEDSITLFRRFFHEIAIAGAPIPKQLVLDYKSNHYVSANYVFNVNLGFEDYLTSCFLYLSDDKAYMLPNCIIYTDIRLVILAALKWNSMCSITSISVKYFYIYCIVLLSLQTSLHSFESILEKVFVIILSEFQNNTTHEIFEYLMAEMKKSKIDTFYNQKNVEIMKSRFSNISDSNSIYKIDYDKCSQILKYIVQIVNKAKQLVVTSGIECERNAFHSEDICKSFMKLCVEFVLWTKLMNNSDSSTEKLSSIDDYLKNYKSGFEDYLLKDSSCIPSVVTYLLKNIEYNQRELENVKSNIQQSKQTLVNQKSELEFLLHNENWKGRNKIDLNYDSSTSDKAESSSSDEELDFNMDDFQNLDITSIIDSVCEESSVKEPDAIKTCDAAVLSNNLCVKNTNIIATQKIESSNKINIKRGTYLRACPEIDLLTQKPTTKIMKRKLIKNYNLLKPRSLKSKKVYIVTSSFFDSLTEILVSSYHSIQKFQKSINEFSDKLTKYKQAFLDLFKEYTKTFNITKFYAARCKLCIDVCELNNDKVTWTKNIGEFLECIIYSNIFTKIECLICKSINFLHFSRLKLSIEKVTSTELSSIIHDHLNTKRNICSCSPSNIVCEYSIRDFFCIDLETETTNTSTIKIEQLVPLLNIANDKFVLTGVIAYEEPIGNNILRHYVAYSRSLTGSWQKYDNINTESSKPEKINERANVNVALLLYFKYDTVEQIDNKKIHTASKETTPEKLSDFQNTVENDVGETSFILNEIMAQSSFIDKDDKECSTVSAMNVEPIANITNEESISYTERCRSNNESTSSEESFSIFINNLCTWRNLLQNGMILPPITLSTQNIKLINTCPLDSIIEVLTAAYCFKPSFNRLIFEINMSSEPNNEVFEIVKQYVNSKSRNLYYEKRLEYCNSQPQLYKQTQNSEYTLIDCRDNIVRLFESVMENVYSVKKTTLCVCDYRNTKQYKILTVNTDIRLQDNEIEKLEDYFKTYFTRTKLCYICKKSARVTYKIMTYFCVELETNFLLHNNTQCYLNSIPTNLHFGNEDYDLVGIIAFDLSYNIIDNLLHYYSFIKLPNNKWEERNNLKNVIICHSKHSCIKIRPALLFYVRRNVYKTDILNFF